MQCTLRSLLGSVLLLALGFAGGYLAGGLGPSAHELAARLGVELPLPSVRAAEDPRPPAPQPAAEQDARAVLGRLADYTRAINTRLERLERTAREKRTAIQLYEARGEDLRAPVVQSLHQTLADLEHAIGELEERRDEALDVQASVRRLADATEATDQAYVDDDESLLDARAFLVRMEAEGLR